MATTPAERKALLFLGAVACLGVGVRVVHAVRGERPAVTAAQPALERQLAKANVAARVERERKGAGKGGGRRARGRRDSSGTAAARRSPAATALAASAGPGATGPVDVDTADSTALATLPGVGPALARRIVEDRRRRGAFGGMTALDGVPGVGPRLLERLAARVTFSGPPRPPSGEDTRRASRSGRARAPRTPVP